MAKIKKSTIVRNGLIVAAILMLLSAVFVLIKPPTEQSTAHAVYEKDGTQIVEITTKGGYFPSDITAKAGKETVIRFTTNGTYDCSAALYIPKLNVETVLPPTGQTDIPAGINEIGSEITGTCSGGSSGFRVRFL